MLKRSILFIAPLILLLVLAACGNSGTASTTSSTPAATATTAPTATTASNAVVMTTTATVKGKSEAVLTNSKGLTLYYFTPDTSTASNCTGACASSWPPLLFSGSGSPTSSGSLSGTLNTISDANGTQVAYNGHLLYNFSGDSAAGQTNGEGLGGKWFVATADLAIASGSASGY